MHGIQITLSLYIVSSIFVIDGVKKFHWLKETNAFYGFNITLSLHLATFNAILSVYFSFFLFEIMVDALHTPFFKRLSF